MHRVVLAAAAGLTVGWLAAGQGNKTQTVRLLDVFFLGPLLLLAVVTETMSPTTRILVAFAAGATVSYNARNYVAESMRGGQAA